MPGRSSGRENCCGLILVKINGTFWIWAGTDSNSYVEHAGEHLRMLMNTVSNHPRVLRHPNMVNDYLNNFYTPQKEEYTSVLDIIKAYQGSPHYYYIYVLEDTKADAPKDTFFNACEFKVTFFNGYIKSLCEYTQNSLHLTENEFNRLVDRWGVTLWHAAQCRKKPYKPLWNFQWYSASVEDKRLLVATLEPDSMVRPLK